MTDLNLAKLLLNNFVIGEVYLQIKESYGSVNCNNAFCPEGIIYANQILISVINCQERHVAKVIEVFLWGSKCSTQSVMPCSFS